MRADPIGKCRRREQQYHKHVHAQEKQDNIGSEGSVLVVPLGFDATLLVYLFRRHT